MCFVNFAHRCQSPCALGLASDFSIVDFLGFGEIMGAAGDVVGGTGIDVLDERQELETDLIAKHVGLEVGGVCNIRLILLAQVGLNVLTTDT